MLKKHFLKVQLNILAKLGKALGAIEKPLMSGIS
jgi:hypothetical protein